MIDGKADYSQREKDAMKDAFNRRDIEIAAVDYNGQPELMMSLEGTCSFAEATLEQALEDGDDERVARIRYFQFKVAEARTKFKSDYDEDDFLRFFAKEDPPQVLSYQIGQPLA